MVYDKVGAGKLSRAMTSTKATGLTTSLMVLESIPGKTGQNMRAHLKMALCMVREPKYTTMGTNTLVSGKKVRKLVKVPCYLPTMIPMKACGKMTIWRAKDVIHGILVIVLQGILYRIAELDKVFYALKSHL